MTTFGFIGLGDIGAPMAERIVDAGLKLVVWNRTSAKSRPLADKGAAAAATPAEVGDRAEVVFLCLDGPEAIEEVVFGAAGLAEGGRVQVVGDSSTTHPQITRALAERLKAQTGKSWIDCPVSGAASGARSGTLATFVGGDAEALELARPALASFSRQITHMGPLGAGQVTKICNQILSFGARFAIGEALNLMRRCGLDSDLMPQAMAGGLADSNMLQEYGLTNGPDGGVGLGRQINAIADLYDGRIDPRLAGALKIGVKDTGIAIDLGAATGSALPVMSAAANMLRILHHQGSTPPALTRRGPPS